jgi:hypothetical protein
MTHPETTMTRPEVRPFRINVPEEELIDLRRRIAATRWPDRETVTDQFQDPAAYTNRGVFLNSLTSSRQVMNRGDLPLDLLDAGFFGNLHHLLLHSLFATCTSAQTLTREPSIDVQR